MTDFQNLIQQLPTQIYLVVGIAFIIGIIIWALGNRLLRPMMLLIGVVAGSSIGFIISGYFPDTVSAIFPVAGGALLFGIIALAVYRMAMSVTLALCLALACPLAYYTYTEIAGTYEGQSGEPLTADDLKLPLTAANEGITSTSDIIPNISSNDLKKATDTSKKIVKDLLSTQSDADSDDATQNENTKPLIPESWRKTMRNSISLVSTTAQNHWHDAPAAQKLGIVVAALAGLLGGFFAGVLLPSASAAIVTALTGSIIMLISGFWIATRFSFPWIDSIRPHSATASLTWWLALSIIGLFIQMTASKRKKHRHLLVAENE